MSATSKALLLENLNSDELIQSFNGLNSKLDTLLSQVQPKPETVLLTQKDVAKLLKVSVVSVWSWTKQGILKAYRIGNQVRYNQVEVIAALQVVKAEKGGKK